MTATLYFLIFIRLEFYFIAQQGEKKIPTNAIVTSRLMSRMKREKKTPLIALYVRLRHNGPIVGRNYNIM